MMYHEPRFQNAAVPFNPPEMYGVDYDNYDSDEDALEAARGQLDQVQIEAVKCPLTDNQYRLFCNHVVPLTLNDCENVFLPCLIHVRQVLKWAYEQDV